MQLQELEDVELRMEHVGGSYRIGLALFSVFTVRLATCQKLHDASDAIALNFSVEVRLSLCRLCSVGCVCGYACLSPGREVSRERRARLDHDTYTVGFSWLVLRKVNRTQTRRVYTA